LNSQVITRSGLRGCLRRCPGKSSSDGNVPTVWEASNTDQRVFQICSSAAFGLASSPMSLKPSRPRPCRQRETNPRPSLSHCEQSSESRAGRRGQRGELPTPAQPFSLHARLYSPRRAAIGTTTRVCAGPRSRSTTGTTPRTRSTASPSRRMCSIASRRLHCRDPRSSRTNR
jgi:hypothetical protein